MLITARILIFVASNYSCRLKLRAGVPQRVLGEAAGNDIVGLVDGISPVEELGITRTDCAVFRQCVESSDQRWLIVCCSSDASKRQRIGNAWDVRGDRRPSLASIGPRGGERKVEEIGGFRS
jgi:hypothetical protein